MSAISILKLERSGFTAGQVEALAEYLDGQAASTADLAEAKAELKTGIARVETELKADLAEAKAELKTEIARVETELKAGVAEAKAELKTGISRVETELKTGIAEVRGELRLVKWMLALVIVTTALPLIRAAIDTLL